MDGHENTPTGGVGFDGNASFSGSNPPQMNNIPNNSGVFSAPQNSVPQDSAAQNSISSQTVAPSQQPTRKYIPNHEQRASGRVFTEQPIVSQPVVSFGENAGDVVIQSKPAKKPRSLKKIAIIGGVVAVIAVVATIFLVQYFSRPSLADVRAAYAEYLDYMKNGPKDENGLAVFDRQNNSWLFFSTFYNDENYLNLDTYVGGGAEDILKDGFLSGLREKFDNFINIAKNARLGSINKTEFREQEKDYRELFNILVRMSDTGDFAGQLFDAYLSGGLEATSELISVTFPEEGYSEEIIRASGLFKEYYSKVASSYGIYQEIDCIDGAFLDMSCAASFTSPQLSLLRDEEAAIYTKINNLYSELRKLFEQETNKISELLGVSNEK